MSSSGAGDEVPAEIRETVKGMPELGTLDAVLALLTVDAEGRVDVCLLSRAEFESTPRLLRLVVAGTKARRNLAATGRATVLAVAGDAAHYVALRVRRLIEDDGAMAAELEPERYLRDDLGVELHPMRFRVEERIAVEERWDRTRRLLERLEAEEVTP